jgi:hypothetical protein
MSYEYLIDARRSKQGCSQQWALNQGGSFAAVVIRSSDVAPVILTPDEDHKRLHAAGALAAAMLVPYLPLARISTKSFLEAVEEAAPRAKPKMSKHSSNLGITQPPPAPRLREGVDALHQLFERWPFVGILLAREGD